MQEDPVQAAGNAKRLVITGLNKWFDQVHVVKDLNIDVQPGEFLVLLGPSGCGKTTALRMIAGLEAAASGAIVIGDTDITNLLPKYRNIAMVFQSYALYPHKTVAENIGFPFKVRGIKGQERDAAVRDAAAQVHMESLLDRYPRQLSGGERQRVALARAIVRRPDVFLMDEPLSNLDAKLRIYMRAELKHMQHELGTTTIYVTHDQVEAMTLAHRVVIMNFGELQQIGTPLEVYTNPRNTFVAGFMGSPPMNLLNGDIAQGCFQCEGVNIPVSENTPSGAAVLGFRPEDAQIVEPGQGQFAARIFAVELAGDFTLVTAVLGDHTVTVKMPMEYSANYDSNVAVRFPPERGLLFDGDSGMRLDGQLVNTD
jgi:multiple sugar transport system ATP-binding protein